MIRGINLQRKGVYPFMLGRDHIIANTASLTMVGTGIVALSEQSSDTPFGALAPFAQSTIATLSTLGDVPQAVVVGMCLAFFAVGTLLPDIDSEKSLLGRHIHLPVGHRTWTHSIWPCIVLAIGGFAFMPLWWALMGYAGHLFWDSLSRGGVCWFYPFSQYITYGSGAKVKRRHALKLYAVGGLSEYVLVGALVVAAVGCVALYLLG